MRKSIALKMMLPLVVLFVLTIIVNVTTTGDLQDMREFKLRVWGMLLRMSLRWRIRHLPRSAEGWR